MNTLNKLIEVSSQKEKNNIKKGRGITGKRQINIPTERTIEQPDKTRVSKIPTNTKRDTINLKRKLLQTRPEKKEQEKK